MKEQKKSNTQTPRVGAEQIRLLEKLCNASGVSGDEGEVRKIVLSEVRPLADEVKVDALGNVLAVRHARAGAGPHLRVMLDAHMDEVGFMLVKDEGEGIFRFDSVGGVEVRYLVGKPVSIGKEHTPGVIGAKPIHLAEKNELKSSLSLDALRIDTGLTSKAKLGDRATFVTPFSRLGPSLRGKALDDRVGVATLIELLRNAPENVELLCAFAVQEEIGGRGARVAAYGFQPDLAIALDVTPARDLPAWDGGENTIYNTRLGAGPAIYAADGSTLADPRLLRYLVQVAESRSIPYQIRQPGSGGTDAGPIHLTRSGVPSISVSVPGRYIHTPVGIVRLEDWQNTLALVHAALVSLPADIFSVDR